MSLKVGVANEETISPISLACFSPQQCADIQAKYDIEMVIQASTTRCYTDAAYKAKGLKVVDDINDCDVLFSVYDTVMGNIHPKSRHFTFAYSKSSHADNKARFNLCELRGSTLVDIDLLYNHQNKPVISISNIAGKVGMHNTIVALGKKTGSYDLPMLSSVATYEDIKSAYKNIDLPHVKFVIIGTGDEALGAIEVLEELNVKKITPELFVLREFPEPVYTHINEYYCAKRKDKLPFTMTEFYDHPEIFESDFSHFLHTTDVLINGYAKRPGAPLLFHESVMQQEDFRISIIADINAVTSTDNVIPCIKEIKTIENSFYGYDPYTQSIVSPFQTTTVDIVAARQWPLALAKDATTQIGDQISQFLVPELLLKESRMIRKATLFDKGTKKEVSEATDSDTD